LLFCCNFGIIKSAGYLCGVGADATFERTDALTQGSKVLADRKSPLDGTFGRRQQLPTLMCTGFFSKTSARLRWRFTSLIKGSSSDGPFFYLNIFTINDIKSGCD